MAHGRVAKRNGQARSLFVDIWDDELLSATQLIESAEDLWACDVPADQLLAASRQSDSVSSLYTVTKMTSGYQRRHST